MGKVCFDDILYIILYNLFMYIILKFKKKKWMWAEICNDR